MRCRQLTYSMEEGHSSTFRKATYLAYSKKVSQAGVRFPAGGLIPAWYDPWRVVGAGATGSAAIALG